MWDIVIIGCGLSGMVAARKLADCGKKVLILEKRAHIGGNLFDEVNSDGFLVQKYGPHCFFTNDSEIRPYIERFIATEDCFVECQTVIDGKRIPMPFNFRSIDLLYAQSHAEVLKKELLEYFDGAELVSVTDLLNSSNQNICEYGQFMYEMEYKLYSAKQWGRRIEDISPEVFHRVPVYLSYKKEYQSHAYQFLPVGGFTKLANAMLNHPNIQVELNCDALKENILKISHNKGTIYFQETVFDGPILYTGELDVLFQCQYGLLPYRSLEFLWKTISEDSYQDTAIVAYPQADKITRITEYKKLPIQHKDGSVISIEIPMEYNRQSPVGNEPYYPIKNEENEIIYQKYLELSRGIHNLYLCGRLADYKYYNMDMVIRRSWEVTDNILRNFMGG